jgi:DNA-directed RNA polymerase specialized sigma24 family protein
MGLELNTEEINQVARNVARNVVEDYPDSLADDLSQEVWLWAMSHMDALINWGVGWKPRFYRSAYRVAYAYARKDRAAAIGYEARDEYFYRVGQLRRMLPLYFAQAWLDLDAELILPDRDAKLDLEAGLAALDPETYQLLVHIYDQDDPEARTQALAASLGVSYEAADKRVYRAVKRLQAALGGPSPHDEWTGRKAMTNAQAVSITRRQYGEG